MSEYVKLKMAQYGQPMQSTPENIELGGPTGPHFMVNAAAPTTVRGASATVVGDRAAERFFTDGSARGHHRSLLHCTSSRCRSVE